MAEESPGEDPYALGVESALLRYHREWWLASAKKHQKIA